MMHPQPEDSRQTIREPTGKQGANETQEIVEDWDRFGNDERDGPDTKRNGNPCDARELGSSDHVLGVSEHAGEYVFGGDVSVDDTSDDDCRNSNAPNCLAHRGGTGCGQGGRGNVWANEDVDDDGSEKIQHRIANLEKRQRLGPILGLLELGDDAEEARMARWVEVSY